MTEITTKVRAITNHEQYNLLQELNAAKNLWHKHGTLAKKTSLQDGNSIYIHWIEFDASITCDRKMFFPETLNIIKTVCDKNLGRIYWHRLQHHDKIDLHNDTQSIQHFNGKLYKRYQLYLSTSNNVKMIIDNAIVASPAIYSNSIFEFALQKNHFYRNDDTTPFYILVFDFMN